MARLIPAFADERTPPGERDVFNMLAAGPDDWVVLHSLDLSPWNRGLRTEIDFLAIIPDLGILCIEVKSHDQIAFRDDRWHPSTITRSPFKQAVDARHSFYRNLRALAPRFSGVPVAHCCVFPRSDFDVTANLAIKPWELIDGRAFRSFESGAAFCRSLAGRLTQHVLADGRLTALTRRMTRAEVDEIVRLCVPIQLARADARLEILHRQEDADRALREQQKAVLRLIGLNPRMVVSGPAGTGKTRIAIEVARRMAESGQRVALLCFNRLVGEWLERQTSMLTPSLPNLVAGRAVRIMAQLVGVRVPPEPSQKFWDTELPAAIEERLTDPEFEAAAAFEYLVLDEAQDFLGRPYLWSCLQRFLAGGVCAGRFCLLGDFDNQVLINKQTTQTSFGGLIAAAHPVHWRLEENCRNYPIVGEMAARLGGMPHQIYRGYLRNGGTSDNYSINYYNNDEQQRHLLLQTVALFKRMGFMPSDITVLSFRRDEDSLAEALVRTGVRLRPAWQQGDTTAYCTVSAFKGLDNKVVIITDVDLHTRGARELFYTGLTRATEYAVVLCNVASQDVLVEWMMSSVE